eukprot:scaffold3_cov31-Tisochrysis_lutea.AAC.2
MPSRNGLVLQNSIAVHSECAWEESWNGRAPSASSGGRNATARVCRSGRPVRVMYARCSASCDGSPPPPPTPPATSTLSSRGNGTSPYSVRTTSAQGVASRTAASRRAASSAVKRSRLFRRIKSALHSCRHWASPTARGTQADAAATADAVGNAARRPLSSAAVVELSPSRPSGPFGRLNPLSWVPPSHSAPLPRRSACRSLTSTSASTTMTSASSRARVIFPKRRSSISTSASGSATPDVSTTK